MSKKKRLDRASIVQKVKPKKVSGSHLVATTLKAYRTCQHHLHATGEREVIPLNSEEGTFFLNFIPTRWRRWLQFCGSENNSFVGERAIGWYFSFFDQCYLGVLSNPKKLPPCTRQILSIATCSILQDASAPVQFKRTRSGDKEQGESTVLKQLLESVLVGEKYFIATLRARCLSQS